MKYFVLAVALLIAGCGNNTENDVQYVKPEEKKVLNDIDTVGCWLRYKIGLDGTVSEEPWSAFYLTTDERYYQTPEHNISEKPPYWDQQEDDRLKIYTRDPSDVQAEMEIKILGYFSEAAHSFKTLTTVKKINITSKDSNITKYFDVIRHENSYSALHEESEPAECKKLKRIAGIE